MTYAVGVIGDGEISRRTANALLNDWHKAKSIDCIYVPGLAQTFSAACRFSIDWAEAHGVDYGILMTKGQDTIHLEDYDLDAHSGVDPDQSNATMAVVVNSDDVFMAWNSADDGLYERTAEIILALDKGLYDFVDGLFPITKSKDDNTTAESDSAGPSLVEPEVSTEAVKTPDATAQPRAAADEAQSLDRDAVREIVREELANLGLLT